MTSNGWPASTGWKRPGAVAATRNDAASPAAGAPSARAAAQAASALSTLKRPGSGTRAGNSPSGLTTTKSLPVPSVRTSTAR